MTGPRRRRLAALVASITLASLTLFIGGSAPSDAAPRGMSGPSSSETSLTILPTTTSTTLPETTTTAIVTTTTFIQTTTTRRPTATTAEQVPTTTSTPLDVSTSVDVLVPGDGTEGAESTTTTTQSAAVISNDGTSDGALVALIVGGLLLLATAVGILTRRYWVATRPPLATAVGSDHG